MLPLEGVRVVEIAQNLAGPVAAEILAHMGADVIKVERPEGDDARRWGPPFFKGTSPGYLAVNANKRSITVDLKDRAAVERLLPLIGEADVLVQNLKPGSLEALGLGADVVTKRFPTAHLLLGVGVRTHRPAEDEAGLRAAWCRPSPG